MIGFENINSRIIAGSVNQYKVSQPPLQQHKPPQLPAPKQEIKNVKNEMHTNNEHAKALKGASIVAGIIVAGIAITKFRGPIVKFFRNIPSKLKPEDVIPPNNPTFTGASVRNKQEYNIDQITNDLFENERLKDRIRERYPKYTNIAVDTIERQKARLEKLLNPSDPKLPFHDQRMFTSHEAEIIGSYQDEYAYNTLLRLGKIRPEASIEIRTMDRMMQEAVPLPKDAVVYRGIVTKHDDNVLDFSREYYAGNIVEDKAYVSTSRNAEETIAQFGEKSGYVMKIKLPAGTKGLDCRRFTTLDLPNGANAEFILPRGSKFRINSVDDQYKIIEADYILQN